MRYILRYKQIGYRIGVRHTNWHVIETVDDPLVPHEYRVGMNQTVYKAETEQEAVDWIQERDP